MNIVREGSPNDSPPTMRVIDQVASAPTGAASEKTAKWALALRLDRPCFSNTAASPKAAGALCIISAAKIMKLSFWVDAVEDAPSAIPSAAA